MVVLRDLAIILLAAEAFLVALVPMVLLGALIYGLWWLQRRENLPSWLKLAQAYTALGQGYVEMAMAIIVRPFLFVNSVVAQVQTWLGGMAKTGGEDR